MYLTRREVVDLPPPPLPEDVWSDGLLLAKEEADATEAALEDAENRRNRDYDLPPLPRPM